MVEFISMIHATRATELTPRAPYAFDPEYLRTYARTMEEAGFDHVLVEYWSGGYDPFSVSAAIAAETERLGIVVALRPNTMHPTVAAQGVATLDQLSGGRVTVHVITGASAAEQARQGDRLPKDERYARAAEFIDILRRYWTEDTPWDHHGAHYAFEGCCADVRPLRPTIPVSVGGSSDAAHRLAGERADIYAMWGEPLRETREQIAAVRAIAGDRAPAPRFWTTFRPIVAATDDEAWRIAESRLARLGSATPPADGEPENEGARRALRIARAGTRYDRALWTAPTIATGSVGATAALVGSPESVAEALADYAELGIELLSIRGYDPLADVQLYGRDLLPLARERIRRRMSDPPASREQLA